MGFSNIEKLLLEIESKCKINVTAPAEDIEILNLKTMHPALPKEVLDIYQISNGVEINVPGTLFYPIHKVYSVNKDITKDSNLIIGVMNFGDEIAVSSESKIIQIDHETGEVYLQWDTLDEFLLEELRSLE